MIADNAEEAKRSAVPGLDPGIPGMSGLANAKEARASIAARGEKEGFRPASDREIRLWWNESARMETEKEEVATAPGVIVLLVVGLAVAAATALTGLGMLL